MATCDALKTLLEDVVIPDIEEEIDGLFEQIAKEKRADPNKKEEFEHLQELRSSFLELLQDLEEGDVDVDECDEIYRELKEMVDLSQG
jgi:ribosome maturation factor RimP